MHSNFLISFSEAWNSGTFFRSFGSVQESNQKELWLDFLFTLTSKLNVEESDINLRSAYFSLHFRGNFLILFFYTFFLQNFDSDTAYFFKKPFKCLSKNYRRKISGTFQKISGLFRKLSSKSTAYCSRDLIFTSFLWGFESV